MPSSLAARGGTARRCTVQVGAPPRDLRRRPEELRQRSAAAGAVRPSVAGQGLPLLGGQRHRLHGDAVLRGHHAEGRAAGDAASRPTRRGCARCSAPLTEALAVIHAEQCYHRDIAPDNVILLAGSDRPLLLDFGAARRVIGDMTQALTVILKPGYAPVEQYAEVPGMKQGAVDRRLRAGRGGLLRDHRQDAADLGRPADERQLRAADAGGGRALQPGFPRGDRPRAGRAAGAAHAKHGGECARPSAWTRC